MLILCPDEMRRTCAPAPGSLAINRYPLLRLSGAANRTIIVVPEPCAVEIGMLVNLLHIRFILGSIIIIMWAVE